MLGEPLPQPKPKRMNQLFRHENGHDVIDMYDVYIDEFATTSLVYVSSIYAKDLDLKFQSITNSSFVPPRSLPYPNPLDQITLH